MRDEMYAYMSKVVSCATRSGRFRIEDVTSVDGEPTLLREATDCGWIRGKPFFLPCNGCDHMRGDSTCSRCCAYVTLRLNGLDYSADDAQRFTLLPPSATPV